MPAVLSPMPTRFPKSFSFLLPPLYCVSSLSLSQPDFLPPASLSLPQPDSLPPASLTWTLFLQPPSPGLYSSSLPHLDSLPLASLSRTLYPPPPSPCVLHWPLSATLCLFSYSLLCRNEVPLIIASLGGVTGLDLTPGHHETPIECPLLSWRSVSGNLKERLPGEVGRKESLS